MQFTIGTAKLNSILSRVIKGVGDSKILPITSYLEVELAQGGFLTVTATNSVNFITYVEGDVEGNPGKVIVQADKLTKLVSRTTKPTMSFDLKADHLEVKGNGTYRLELFETNEYPTYDFNHEAPRVELETALLKRMFSVNKSAIATEMLMPCLTAYNVGSNVITTDGVKMCINETTVLANERVLITQSLADLAGLLTADRVTIQRDENKLLLTTENIIIFGVERDGLADFPDISGLAELKHPGYAIVNKAELMSALERLELFVDPMNNHGVRLIFTVDGVAALDFKENSQETVAYVEKSLDDPGLEIVVNLNYLNDLLNAIAGDKVSLHFGKELPLAIKDKGITLILSTMEGQ